MGLLDFHNTSKTHSLLPLADVKPIKNNYNLAIIEAREKICKYWESLEHNNFQCIFD
jgi:hypothetical protein